MLFGSTHLMRKRSARCACAQRRWLAWSWTDDSSRRLCGCAPRSEPTPTRATRLRSSGFCVTASWTSRRRRRRRDAPDHCSQVSLTRCAGAGSVLFGVARRGVREACSRGRGDRGGNWQSAAAGGARPGASALLRALAVLSDLRASARAASCAGQSCAKSRGYPRSCGARLFFLQSGCVAAYLVSQETERLCVYLMDEALSQMHAEGRAQTVLTVFDLRGFGCVAAASAAPQRHALTAHLVARGAAPRTQTFRSFASSSSA